jgi:predicted dehydrogenase
MNLTPEEKEVGKENYYDAIGENRRDFLKKVSAASAVSGGGLGAMYFDYSTVAKPVRVGVIGTGDEGSVLIGAVNPSYVQVVAIADIRPYNIHRAFHGDHASPAANAARPGLITKYQWKNETEARKHVKVYKDDYHDLLNDPDVEAVIIALPLHLHAKVAVEAMMKDKHVLTEKLMAKTVAQCKVMSRVAAEQNLHLATGHQRHYSVLYDNAVNLIRWGVLGEIHHIRAQWHRGNLPGRDSWQQPIPGGEIPFNSPDGKRVDKIAGKINSLRSRLAKLNENSDPLQVALYTKQLAQWEAWDKDQFVDPTKYGYREFEMPKGHKRSAMEELCRWRLWDRTGGGLMAELGSHQLDAAGIFVNALREDKDGKKVHPLTVHATGGRHLFGHDRDVDDHVYCMFEFPGPGNEKRFDVGYRDPIMGIGNDSENGVDSYAENPNKKIVVSYSSINGNGFGGYGEIVMGTKGTLVLEKEKDLLMYQGSNTTTRVGVKDSDSGPTMDTQASGEAGPVAKAAETGPVSRGYTEEIEHWAYCIRNPDPENVPRCRPEVALGDAVIALTTNVAIKAANSGKGGFIEFKDEWYDINSDETSDGSDITAARQQLTSG